MGNNWASVFILGRFSDTADGDAFALKLAAVAAVVASTIPPEASLPTLSRCVGALVVEEAPLLCAVSKWSSIAMSTACENVEKK